MTLKDIAEDEKKEGLHPKYDMELQQEESEREEQHTPQLSIKSNTPTMRRNNNCSSLTIHDTLEQGVYTPNINFGNGLTQDYIKHQ
jgi:hypothetical protein